jgi:hypothetical protein
LYLSLEYTIQDTYRRETYGIIYDFKYGGSGLATECPDLKSESLTPFLMEV